MTALSGLVLTLIAQYGGGPVADRQTLADDVTDHQQIVFIDRHWNRAVRLRDRAAERHQDARLALWLQHELSESSQEAARAAREARYSRGRHDRRDDRQDAQLAAQDVQHLREITIRLREIQPQFERRRPAPEWLYAQKRNLIAILAADAAREVQTDQQELSEDRSDRRDRRDRRDHRRDRIDYYRD